MHTHSRVNLLKGESLGFALRQEHRGRCQSLVAKPKVHEVALEVLLKVLRQIAPQQFIFGADKTLCAARVALARAAPEELPIHAPRLVPLSGNDMKPAELGDAVAEPDVGAAAGHVSRDSNPTWLSSAGNNFGFLTVLARIEYDSL